MTTEPGPEFRQSGHLSPDGRHQWNGTEWEKIPPPPMDFHAYFQVFCVILLVVIGFIALFAAFGQ